MAVLTDTRRPGHPVVWASDPFCAFTGYAPEEVVGRGHWSFVTDRPESPGAWRLRASVEAGRSAHAVLVGRKKDGTEFDDAVTLYPIREDPSDVGSPVQYAFAVHLDTGDWNTGPAGTREPLAVDPHDGLERDLAELSLLAHTLATRLDDEGSEHAPAAARVAALTRQVLASATGRPPVAIKSDPMA